MDDVGIQSFTMLWDESFRSWTEFSVSGQPTVILLASDGRELGRWFGAIPDDEVLALAGSA